MLKKTPVVTIKFAQTVDGKIADRKGNSRWISGPEALKFAHKLRVKNQAVLVGVNTVLKDDPLLTVRRVKGNNPIRIIVDSKLRTPLEAKVAQVNAKAQTIIATTKQASKRKRRLFQKKGVKLLLIPENSQGRVDLGKLLVRLGKLGIKNLLVEGGSEIISSFLKHKLAKKLIVIIAPKILGKGLSSINEVGVFNIKHSLVIKLVKVKRIGRDLLLIATLKDKGGK